jgi:NADPH:quinone reductase-like Zn-dependent oxidoreductase
MTAFDLFVSRSNLREVRVAPGEKPDIGEGEVLLAVDAFSLTANNVTYAVFGDAMKYWDFFPAPEGWGRVPVWGFATVAESRAEGIAAGQKVYGYLPTSTWLKIAPGPVRNGGFADLSPHRAGLAAVYNRYEFTATDPLYTPETEALQMLFRPLFITSFVIDDFLADNDFFGAEQVIFSSASAKTAYATAQLLTARGGVAVTGLTSARNMAFVKDLGCYGAVVSYDDIATLDAKTPTVFVDIAGDAAVRGRVHAHFNDALTYSCAVGATHWDGGAGGGDLPGPKPQMFFAPTQIQKRHAELGPAAFQSKVGEAWRHFLTGASSSTRVVTASGLDEAAKLFASLVAGDSKADEGNVVRLR